MTRHSTVLLILISTTSAFAQFDLAATEPLQITFGGEVLTASRWVTPELEGLPSIAEKQVEEWDRIIQVWQPDEGSKLRQEIAVRPDRVELTHIRLVEPDVTGSQVAGLLLNADLLDGARVEFIGAPKGRTTAQGAVQSGTLGDDGVTRIKYLKLLRLHLPGGAIDFDCEPRGVWVGGYGISPAASRWALYRSDDGWLLVATHGKSRVGALHDAKLVITPASDRPLDEVHPVANTRWTAPYSPTLQVSVGVTPVSKYETCAMEAADEWVASWADPAALRLERDERFVDVRAERVEGAVPLDPTQPAGLRIKVERDGWYLVSLLAGSPDRAVGPCEIFAGYGDPRTTPEVAAGEYGSWPVIGHAVDRLITVRITGDFRIVAAQLAPMMYDNEDYWIERTWWVSEDFHPDDDLPL